jgi:hypothetical protein
MTVQDIDALVADLRPIRRFRPAHGIALALVATAMAVLAVATMAGLRDDVIALAPDPVVVLRAGALLSLGIATLAALAVSARPGTGGHKGWTSGWGWAVAAAGLFPLASVLTLARGDDLPAYTFDTALVRSCLTISLTSALAVFGTIVTWLRRGAATNLPRTGWLVGLASGGLGTFAYSLHCPSTSLHYIAIWYGFAVIAAALFGRLTVPMLIRW